MVEIEPLHAHCFFSVSKKGEFHQYLVYDYYDEEGCYAELLHKPREYRREMAKLAQNMQEELDKEIVKVNGERVYPRVMAIAMEHRGSRQLPYIAWIIKFKGKLKKGINIFENLSEEEIAQYDYEVVWCFPLRTKIINVEVKGECEVLNGPTIMIWARKGMKVGGLERIVFKL